MTTRDNGKGQGWGDRFDALPPIEGELTTPRKGVKRSGGRDGRDKSRKDGDPFPLLPLGHGGKTSEESPLGAHLIPTETLGTLYVTFAPGKKQTGKWNRSLPADLARLRGEPVKCDLLVSLVEDFELRGLGVGDLAEECAKAGIVLVRSPVPDGGIPALNVAESVARTINDALRRGENVVVHCKGGLGRAGTMVACVLVVRGKSPKLAMAIVRKHRKGAIENPTQEKFIVALRDAMVKRRKAARQSPTVWGGGGSYGSALISPTAPKAKATTTGGYMNGDDEWLEHLAGTVQRGGVKSGLDDVTTFPVGCKCYGKPPAPMAKGGCPIHPDR